MRRSRSVLFACFTVVALMLPSFAMGASDNDAGSGRDAPDGFAGAILLSRTTLAQGRLVGSDVVDTYAVQVSAPEKITAIVQPIAALGEESTAHPDVDIELYSPSYVLREHGSLEGIGGGDRVELNADESGLWYLRILRRGDAPAFYLLTARVSALARGADNDARTGGDAPDSCALAAPLAEGAYRGSIFGGDVVDWYSTHVDIGERLVLTLKPTEHYDAADFDLSLWEGCNVHVATGANGKNVGGLAAKGMPDFGTVITAQATMEYHFAVVRVNGVGSYTLTVTVHDPQPTLPLVPKEGDDAPPSTNARPTATPAVFQGSLPDGDTEDAYAFFATAGQVMEVDMIPGALSNIRLIVHRPQGAIAFAADNGLGTPQHMSFTADETGWWVARVHRINGGGEYLMGIVVV